MIGLLLFVPIIGSLILLPIKEDSIKNKNKMKSIALITSLINLLISIFLWLEFDSSTTQYQYVYEFNQLSFCHFNMGVDGISLYFILLTTFITPIALLSNYTNITKNLKFFFNCFLIIRNFTNLSIRSIRFITFLCILRKCFTFIIYYNNCLRFWRK